MAIVRPYSLSGNTVLTEITITSGDLTFSSAGNLIEGSTAVFSFDTSGNITKIGQDTPSTNEVLTWDGAKWVASPGGGGGDITGVTAGTGLSGGGTTGDVTLSVDNTVTATLGDIQTFTAVKKFTGSVSVGDTTDTPAAVLEVTSSATVGTPLLQLNNLDLDQTLLDINASNTTGNVIDITADAVTTGSVFNLYSNSSSTGGRVLAGITNDNTLATNTVLFSLKNDALGNKGNVVIETTAAETNPLVDLVNSNTATDKPAILQFKRDSSTVADDMELGQINFTGKDSADEQVVYSKIVGFASDVTHPGDEQGQLSFYAMSDAGGATSTMVEMLRLGAEDSGASPTISTVQVNVGNNDVDFIVRGTSINSLIRTDAANNAVGINQSAPIDGSAIFEIESTTKGFLPPRMTTTERNAISAPAAGLVIYDTTTNKLQCYNGSTWNNLF